MHSWSVSFISLWSITGQYIYAYCRKYGRCRSEFAHCWILNQLILVRRMREFNRTLVATTDHVESTLVRDAQTHRTYIIEDSIETNASSFSREMTELAHVLNVLQHSSQKQATHNSATQEEGERDGQHETGGSGAEPESETRFNTTSIAGTTTLVILDEVRKSKRIVLPCN
jgi:hypothetical protein